MVPHALDIRLAAIILQAPMHYAPCTMHHGLEIPPAEIMLHAPKHHAPMHHAPHTMHHGLEIPPAEIMLHVPMHLDQVNVGSMLDPSEFPGLAHFTEVRATEQVQYGSTPSCARSELSQPMQVQYAFLCTVGSCHNPCSRG